MQVRGFAVALVVGVSALVPAAAAAHWLDHAAPPPISVPAPASTANSGGPGAEWELIDTITTGNPHSDLDFFTQGGETYASVGTLAAGPNGGGQSIIRLTENGEVNPSLLAQHPSASCLSNPSAATGLQHDVEASPKGNAILNVANPYAVRTDTQVLIDASDAQGRCHDQGVLGIEQAPQGGLEIVDVTDPATPVEIGLTAHIGEAHTVNVDPKRPHIAYAVTSDAITVNEAGERQNEVEGSADALDLDGFEVVDLSSCMNFPAGTTVDQKRTACRPQVFRYRYPNVEMALGHTVKTGGSAIFGCHELEVYPDDKLTCGSGNALIELDMSGAFNDMGTPTDFSDDKPRGTPLPCQVRDSSTVGPTATEAMVTDCVDGPADGATDLDVPGWIAAGSPSLQGVGWLGSVIHQGGGPGQTTLPPLDSTQDLAFNHESEFSGSGQTLLATDERGGGIVPPGAACDPTGANIRGNGGVHFYDPAKLTTTATTPSPEQAQRAYKKTPDGELAIYRAQIRTQPEASFCTAHVFQQIPGENRIFMGWYSQGTQVIDFVENNDGTIRFAYAGHFIPENADTWVSHVFKTERNPDGTTTYYGATGDFVLGPVGRNSVDVWKVTLPPAPASGAFNPGGGGGGGGGGGLPGACDQRIPGTKNADTLLGSIAGDLIIGRRGDDEIKARAGDDCARGGNGRDDVRGGAMDDLVKGGRGADSLKGGGGDDKVRDRSAGSDRLGGNAGADRLRSRGGGKDVVLCGKGEDRAVVDERDRTRGCEKVKRR
jgi:Ca2+-binding RTX toxin-like protein